jgi:broad specificity phosphatase PhoE
VVGKVILVRHAEPLVTEDTPGSERPLTESGRKEATILGGRLARRCSGTVVWTSPERRASETAALAFPAAVTTVRDELSEVKRPWSASLEEYADAVGDYLRGEVVEGWELREDVTDRIARLKADFRSALDLVLVTHGVLLTCWLDHEMGIGDPFSFWRNLRMPDAWELDLGQNSAERIA